MTKKILLPHGCTMSTPSVNPKNWNTGGSSNLKKNWHIQYYFYSSDGKRKLVITKGMNNYKNLSDRKSVTKELIAQVIENNRIGYNPITKIVTREYNNDIELHQSLYFITAFRIASSKIKCSEVHRKQIGYCISRIEKKVVKLGMKNVTIEQFTRRQLKQLLESCNLPNSYYNKYLAFLSRLFAELIEYDCCENNIVRDMRKRKVVKTQREILSPENHKTVMAYLHENFYEFWRYSKIFLYSGARTTELFRVKVKDIDIENQEYKTIILKGSNPQEVTKVILKEVIPLWVELLKNAKSNEYLFSRGLKAGKEAIKPYQITKRWLKLVKNSDKIKNDNNEVVNITADFYSMKHSFLDSLPEHTAMLIASHSNSKTTAIYRVNQGKRNREELKKL